MYIELLNERSSITAKHHIQIPMIKNLLLLLSFFLLAACATTKKTDPAKTEDLELARLLSYMEGTFSSALQSQTDTSYFNIQLVMTPIWANRTDGRWLYVEQAAANSLDKPYRQRVYHLQHPSKGIFTSDIYTIKDAAAFAGLQNDNSKREKLSFDRIELKEGCTVTLKESNGVYEGGTTADKCPSDLRGAKYTTTKIRLQKGELYSWDQGFDATGKQVWGATKGGYIFIKQ